ncbi:MAG: hypothetical protein AAFS10_26235 [Myxococcota bacterium]
MAPPPSSTLDLGLTRCPCCRARLDPAAPLDEPCRRCESPLALLRGVYQAAAHWRYHARRALADDRPHDALRCALRATHLVYNDATRTTLCAALAAAGLGAQALDVLPKRTSSKR